MDRFLLLLPLSALACQGGTRFELPTDPKNPVRWETGARSSDGDLPSLEGGGARSAPSSVADTGASSSDPSPPPGDAFPEGGVQPGPGILTAGSFDDHLNPDAFRRFLDTSRQLDDAQSQAPVVEHYATIVVANTQGQPIAFATLQVQAQGKTLPLVTGTDGRALFVPNRDGFAPEGEFKVRAEKNGATTTETFDLATPSWALDVDTSTALVQAMDLAFVVDATGSMGDELEFLKAETTAIVNEIQSRDQSVDLRFGLIVYRDEGDEYVTRGYGFAGLTEFLQFLDQQSAGGGGDYPEAMHTALQEAAAQLPWRNGPVSRMLFLMADAPPHDNKIAPSIEAFDALRHQGVRVYPIAASGVADLAEYVMRTGSFLTLGRYLFLTDDSAVGHAHAEPRVPCYDVELLKNLMVRMITSELKGRLSPPNPDTIIRTIGTPSSGVCPQQAP